MFSSNRPFVLPKLTAKQIAINFDKGVDYSTDSNNLPIDTATSCFNVTVGNNCIDTQYGIERWIVDSECQQIIDSARTVWQIGSGADRQYIIHTAEGKLYSYNLDNKQLKQISSLTHEQPYKAQYFDDGSICYLVLSNSSRYLIYNGRTLQQIPDNNYASILMHNDRMFGISGQDDKLHFSKIMDASNWLQAVDKGGYITMGDNKGNIVDMVSFDGYLYLFREQGLVRLTTSGDQQDFTIQSVSVECSQVIPNSAQNCGKYIIFATKQAMYKFDGSKTEKLSPALSKLILEDNANCISMFAQGKYMLAFRANFGNKCVQCEKTSYTNNALFVYQLYSGQYSIVRGIDISALNYISHADNIVVSYMLDDSYHSGILSCSGCVDNNVLPKYWQGGTSTLNNSNKYKIVTQIDIVTKYNMYIDIIADGKTHRYALCGSDNLQHMRCNVKGKQIALAFGTLSPKMHISSVVVNYSVVE